MKVWFEPSPGVAFPGHVFTLANPKRVTCPITNCGATLPNSDGDMHPDPCDNCVLVDNPAQTDSDADGLGDLCDPTPVPESGRFVTLLGGALLLVWLSRRH